MLSIRDIFHIFFIFCSYLLVCSRCLAFSDTATHFVYSQLLDEFWMWRLSESPEFATTVGMHAFDDKLELFTEESFLHRKRRCEDFLRRINSIDKKHLTENERENLDLLEYELKTFVEGFDWRRFSTYNPLNNLEGLHKDFSLWIDGMLFDSPADFHAYKGRLRSLASQINEQVNLMRIAAEERTTNHAISIQSVIIDIDKLLDEPARTSPFFAPFNSSLERVDIDDVARETLRDEVEMLLEDHTFPTYKKLNTFIQKGYLPNTRSTIGVSSLQNGFEFYKARLKWYLSAEVSPSYLYNTGQQTVEILTSKMLKMKERLQFSGSVQEFLRYTHGANKFFYKTKEELIDACKNIVFNELTSIMKHIVYNYTLPDIIIEPMSFDGPMAVVMPGSEDGLMPAIFFVNVRNPFKQPKWKLRQAIYREIAPGRLFQITHARNQKHPNFRKFKEVRKMYSIPFQYPFYLAYTEGWSLYAEILGSYMTTTSSSYDRVGEVYSELYSTTLQVTDVGIHAFGWNKDEAIEYLRIKTGVSTLSAEAITNNIITQPGQAIASSYGCRFFKHLRQAAQQRLGENFNIKDFHQRILASGPVPLTFIKQKIHTWLDRESPLLNTANNGISLTDIKLRHFVIYACLLYLLLLK